MSRRVISITEETGIDDAARLLAGERIRRLPVLRQGKLVNLGTQASLTKGRICLQAEAADILYRNIELTPLE